MSSGEIYKDLSDISISKEVNQVVYGVLVTDNAVLKSNNESINISAENSGNGAGYTSVVGVGAEVLTSGNKYTDGGTIYLGEKGITKDIQVSATATKEGTYAIGLDAARVVGGDSQDPAGPSKIYVSGDNLTINVNHLADSNQCAAVGIMAQNNTGDATNRSSVMIDTENTIINVYNPQDSTVGIQAFSQGLVDVNSNIEIHASDVISARGNAIVNINADGQHSTKLYGDVDFAYDQPTSGTPVDAQLNINLSGADSVWVGNSKVTVGSGSATPSDEYLQVSAFKLAINDEAQWTTDEDSFVNSLSVNHGIININGDAAQTVNIGTMQGTGTVNMKTEKSANGFSAGTLNIAGTQEETSGNQLNINFTGINADDIQDVQRDMNALAGNVKIAQGASVTSTARVGEGLISGAISAQMNNGAGTDGVNTVTVDNIQQARSTSTMENMKNIAAVNIVAWRQEDSTFSQRLGDLRASKEGQGIWARMSRGEFEYSGAFKNQYNYFQIGYDWANGDWHYGAAVSHNDGETSYVDGYGENDSTSLSLYGTRLMNDGQYLDLVLKVGRLSNEFDNYAEAGHTHGDYDSWGTEISGEYGKKLGLKEGWFVTPQAQLSLMRIGSEAYTTSNGIHVDQETLYSAVGRVGFEAGKDTSWGNFYAKASVLHEFAGDADTYLELNGISNSYSQDIGDTWYEAGFGFNWKMGNGGYFYADVIRTFGGDIETPWQWNAGVRWGF